MCGDASTLGLIYLTIIIISELLSLVNICLFSLNPVFILSWCVHVFVVGFEYKPPMCIHLCLRRSTSAAPHSSRAHYNLRGSTCLPPQENRSAVRAGSVHHNLGRGINLNRQVHDSIVLAHASHDSGLI